MTDYTDYVVSGILRVKNGAETRRLSDTIVLLDNDSHTFRDLKIVDGLRGFELRFNERKRTLTVRQSAPKPAATSSIDAAFAAIADGDDGFTLDNGPTPEEKFKTVCKERGYDADLSKRVREIIAQYGSSEAVKNRLNDLLKARKAKVMRKEDWAVAQELTATK